MLPIIAAAARAAGTAAKAAKASRAVKTADEVYNARRRYVRKAERYLKQAEQSYGAVHERYMFLAKNEAERALSTYDKEPNFQKLSKGLQKVALETGAQFSEPANDYQREQLKERSKLTLETKQNRQEHMEKRIMASTIGSRIIASLESVWSQYDSVKDAEPAIFEKLSRESSKSINSWFDVIELYESNPEFGERLYSEPKSDLRYDDIVQAAQKAFNL